MKFVEENKIRIILMWGRAFSAWLQKHTPVPLASLLISVGQWQGSIIVQSKIFSQTICTDPGSFIHSLGTLGVWFSVSSLRQE